MSLIFSMLFSVTLGFSALPDGVTAGTDMKIKPQDVPCGEVRELYENKHGADVVVKAELTFTCNCGEGAEAKAILWGDNYTENYPCKLDNGEPQKLCGFEVPSGVKLSFGCINDDVPADKRPEGGKCALIGKIESVVVRTPEPAKTPEPTPEPEPQPE